MLVTGAGTGIGKLTARALAHAGHTVHTSMRDIQGRNAGRVEELLEEARRDEVVHNTGHLFVGYVEAFTPEDITHLFDINALGIQRVNRAALPHMRERRSGTMVYVGSTTSAVVPPFLGPNVASKFAADALAQVTSCEVNTFGIETTIVMLGPFTKGTKPLPERRPRQ